MIDRDTQLLHILLNTRNTGQNIVDLVAVAALGFGLDAGCGTVHLIHLGTGCDDELCTHLRTGSVAPVTDAAALVSRSDELTIPAIIASN